MLFRRCQELAVDLFDQVVALLIELIDPAFRLRDRSIITDASFVFFVPQVDVGLRQPADQLTDLPIR